ncbi:MAG: hypothetical protein ACJ73L_12435 [Actinomycetes bacterium]
MTDEELNTTRRRLEAMAVRARNNASYEADSCARALRDLDLTNTEAGTARSQAERLAQASTALTGHLSALEAYEVALIMLEEQ